MGSHSYNQPDEHGSGLNWGCLLITVALVLFWAWALGTAITRLMGW